MQSDVRLVVLKRELQPRESSQCLLVGTTDRAVKTQSHAVVLEHDIKLTEVEVHLGIVCYVYIRHIEIGIPFECRQVFERRRSESRRHRIGNEHF